jgi:hypothetical protein
MMSADDFRAAAAAFRRPVKPPAAPANVSPGQHLAGELSPEAASAISAAIIEAGKLRRCESLSTKTPAPTKPVMATAAGITAAAEKARSPAEPVKPPAGSLAEQIIQAGERRRQSERDPFKAEVGKLKFLLTRDGAPVDEILRGLEK